MQIVWTRRALTNLAHIRHYIGSDNPAAAERLARRIETAVANLQQFPESCPVWEVPGTRKLVVSGSPYLLIYRIYHYEVQILHILHSKQRWPD